MVALTGSLVLLTVITVINAVDEVRHEELPYCNLAKLGRLDETRFVGWLYRYLGPGESTTKIPELICGISAVKAEACAEMPVMVKIINMTEVEVVRPPGGEPITVSIAMKLFCPKSHLNAAKTNNEITSK